MFIMFAIGYYRKNGVCDQYFHIILIVVNFNLI